MQRKQWWTAVVGEEAGSRASEGTHMADANYWPSGASRVQLGEFTFTEEWWQHSIQAREEETVFSL